MLELLFVAQDAPHITQFVRPDADTREWVRHDYGDLAAKVDLPSIQCVLSLSDVYEGVDFN
jgi:hypothetical protein